MMHRTAAALAATTALSTLRRDPRVLIARNDATANPAELVRQFTQAFEAFKAANDERLKQIEAKGASDPLTEQKVDRINAEITRLQTDYKAAMVDLETRLNRERLANGANDNGRARNVAALNQLLGAAARAQGRERPAEIDAAGYEAYRVGVYDVLRTGGRNNSVDVRNMIQIGSDPDGGYLCPPEVDQAIDRVLQQLGALRQAATVRPIGGASYKKYMTTSGAGFGGWGNERTTPSETATQQLAELLFTPHNMWAEPRTTSDVLEDAFLDIEQWLADEVGITFYEQESSAFITGDGVTKPRGLLSYPIVANASYAWGKVGYTASGGASDFAASNPSDNLIDLVHSLRRQYRGNASWIMNDLTLSKIRKFKDGFNNYLWVPGLQNGMVGTLLGYPVLTDDFMPDVAANAYPVAFGDFKRAYLIVDRRGTTVLRDPFTAKPQIKFYTTRRVGGGVQNFEAFKVMKIAAS